jgi:hypothetical protein
MRSSCTLPAIFRAVASSSVCVTPTKTQSPGRSMAPTTSSWTVTLARVTR